MNGRVRIEIMKNGMCSLLISVMSCWAVSAYACNTLRVEGDSVEVEGISEDTVICPDKMVRPDTTACNAHQLKLSRLIVPAVMVGTGVIALESDWLKYQNKEVRDELQENIDRKFTIDDFSQYLPMASVYALNMIGVKGKHNFRDRTIILGTAALIMASTVNALKYTTRVERPDGSTRNSFPSGHTATAFMGAEFLRREYWDVSPWIGVAGYAIAAGTGYFRLYNNRHWLSDVIAGAGIGIISTELAYWLYPKVSEWILPRSKRTHVVLVPCVSRHERGLACSITF